MVSKTDTPAILGGRPEIEGDLQPYRSIGEDEREAILRVVDSGCLSGFYGSCGEKFLGGPTVRAFEEAWKQRFGTRHAVSVNSATSGLFAAVGAARIGQGDEVIVPPLTMSATAMAPLVYGATPIFVDVEPETFTLDPDRVRAAITPRTRAIIAVNLFGHPARLAELKEFADANDLVLIEDNAQAPLAKEHGKYAGTIGHIGVFSLNYHKHVHTGEGGICVTEDDELALRLQLIRNHGENVVEPLGIQDAMNLVGFNYRLTELSAAVGIAQLKKIDSHVNARVRIAERLSREIDGLEGLTPPRVRSGCTSVHYLWSAKVDASALGVDRARFSRALAAEGFPHFLGYVKPLYMLPVFRNRHAFKPSGYPFDITGTTYPEGLCPVAERLWREELLCFETCMYDVDAEMEDALVRAILKVHEHRHALTKVPVEYDGAKAVRAPASGARPGSRQVDR